MIAIIGLGNPGAAYEKTRHNVGFQVLDLLSRRYGIPIARNKCRALAGEGNVAGTRLALLKPQTFMNLSGQSVQEALNWYKLTPADLLIISDDIDLAPGTLRVRPHGGAGTHNGWKSILQQTGSDRFPRIRVGVGSPPEGWDLADWVLSGFGGDQALMDAAYLQAADAADCFLRSGIDAAMNRYNVRRHEEPLV
ncbi:MAG: aminoacyl-tRNA hydrolase [Christensenellales bacterium]